MDPSSFHDDGAPSRITVIGSSGGTKAAEMATIETAMYGGQRAGKTTLLTQMMAVVRREVEKAGLNLNMSHETQGHFERARRDLETLVSAVLKGESGFGTGIAGTDQAEGVRSYGIGIRNSDNITAAALTFHDYSGEHLSNLSAAASEAVLEALQRSQALIVAINTPTMMAAIEDGSDALWELHRRSNWTDPLDRLFTDGFAPGLVLLCPIKCELWLTKDPSGGNLLKAVREAYSQPLRTLRKKSPASRVKLIPVVTVGAVEFDGFIDDSPGGLLSPAFVKETFRPAGAGAAVEPRLNDQPLRHVMRHVLDNVSYDDLADAHFDDPDGDFFKGVVSVVAHVWTSLGLPTIPPIGDFVDEFSGMAEYTAAAQLVASSVQSTKPVYDL